MLFQFKHSATTKAAGARRACEWLRASGTAQSAQNAYTAVILSLGFDPEGMAPNS
jgi:hypothetical protein